MIKNVLSKNENKFSENFLFNIIFILITEQDQNHTVNPIHMLQKLKRLRRNVKFELFLKPKGILSLETQMRLVKPRLSQQL